MKNQISDGRTLDYTVPAEGVKSGDVVLVNDVAGIATTDGKEGDTVALAVRGVFSLPKGGGIIQQGKMVYYNATDKNVVADSSDNTFIGYAWETAPADSPYIIVKLSF